MNTTFIPVSQPSITEEDIALVADAVRSGWVSSLGEYITRFEEEFARFCGSSYALTVSNGTAALHLALAALDTGPGDEVIVPDFTFVATANAVTYTGAQPVFVDIDAETLCIDPASMERAITKRTKAVIAVHLYGHPAAMDDILSVAREKNLHVIEDAAEAHGARINGKRVGSLGTFGTFSFYGNKIITTGEGGMLTTDCPRLYGRAKELRDHAMSPDKRYWHTCVGYNYRMTNIQAALGVAQLSRIEQVLFRRSQIFSRYRERLSGLSPLTINRTAPWAENSYWAVNIENLLWDEPERNAVMARLKERGVDSRPYFYPVSDMPPYRHIVCDTPVAHRISPCGITLPSFSAMTDDQIDAVCTALRDSIAREETSAYEHRNQLPEYGSGLCWRS